VTTRTIDGFIVTPRGVLHGRVTIAGDRIAAVEGLPVPGDAWRDGSAPVVLPGFIDLHVHGGGGADIMQAAGDEQAIDTVARTHARHGTTSLLATTMTAPREEIEAALCALAPACRTRMKGAARVLGVHLEGPYISPDKLGAQPAFAAPPSARDILALNAIAPLRVVTLAPELPGALDVVTALAAAGIRVQLGHSAARYEDACAALERGASGFTHLFNAMSPLHQRAPGVVGAALAHAAHAEIIPDLLHVHPGAIRAALRAIPGLYCVTDSTSAAAMPDGDYTLGRQRVRKCLGGVRLADGTLAGSTLTMDQALRNLVGPLGLPLVQAALRVATHAARYLGLADRGAMEPGAFADLVVMNGALDLQRVIVEGDDVLTDA
jgi:N-acetylglucosamine-6-phosphate deacetylase